MGALPGCIITDYAVTMSSSGVVSPLVGSTVKAAFSLTPLFVKQDDNSYRQVESVIQVVTAAGTGQWSVTLPSQGNCDPNTETWTITLPDGTAWNGIVTAAMVTASQATALTIHDLKTTYGWGLLAGAAGGLVNAVQGPTGPMGAAGPVGATWRGAWSSSSTYAINDVVSSAGSSYICTLGNMNQAPPNATYWLVVAQVGAQGPQGPQGQAGASYTLPTSSASVLGGVKVGANLSIDGSGVLSASALATSTIQMILDGGGAALATGIKGDIVVPYNCTVQAWEVLGDQSGSITLDVWRATYGTYPPVVSGSITGTEQPSLVNQSQSQASTLTGWTTALSAGDILRVNVSSASIVQRVTLSLSVVPSSVPPGGVPAHAATHAAQGSDRLYYDKGHNGLNGGPARLETIARDRIVAAPAMTSQTIYLTYVTAEQAAAINQALFVIGTVFAGCSYANIGLYTVDSSDAATLVRQSGDVSATLLTYGTVLATQGTATGFTAAGIYGVPLALDGAGATAGSPYALARGQRYAVGLLLAATTMGAVRAFSMGATAYPWLNTGTYNGTSGLFVPCLAKSVSAQATLPTSVSGTTGSGPSFLHYVMLAP